MMNADEQRDYLEAVDELRRLQVMTPRPPNQLQARKLAEQAARVDAFTARYLERFTAPAAPGPATSSA